MVSHGTFKKKTAHSPKKNFWGFLGLTHITLLFTYGSGVKHSPQHSIFCKKDDFMTVRHSNLCKITALLLSRCVNTMMQN